MFWKKSSLVANVIEAQCTNCQSCIRICRRHALQASEMNGKTGAFMNGPEKCTGCGKCARICPENAIRLIKRQG
ncbi:MAG: ferredoxin family protein [Dysgonamonadaceae bacterium]|nr:ferredoxin family protein [Dysgonamonadaceae bacterium]